MSQLYDRAEIYDLIENEKRTESIRRDWKHYLGQLPCQVKAQSGVLSLGKESIGTIFWPVSPKEGLHYGTI